MNLELAPQFVQDIDWDLFKKQREVLIRLAPFEDVKDEIEGLIALCDGICDYATDICGVPEETVFLTEEE